MLTVITETDVVGGVRPGYYLARQPDGENLRTWEIPGTAHADNYTIKVSWIDTGSAPLDEIVAAYAPTNVLMGQQLDKCINFAPSTTTSCKRQSPRCTDGCESGEPAPIGSRIELTDADPPQPVVDANGIARGGVRTPWVDVPTARTSGAAIDDSIMCQLFGTGEPFDSATLRRLYPNGVDEYLERFTEALDAAIGVPRSRLRTRGRSQAMPKSLILR